MNIYEIMISKVRMKSPFYGQKLKKEELKQHNLIGNSQCDFLV
jgi:hypothetical protein